MTANPTGSAILMMPTDVSGGIPKEGMDFFLGPELQDSLKKTLDGVCKDGLSKDCTSALSGLFDKDHQFTIESRQVGALLFAGRWAAISIAVIMGWLNLKEGPQKLASIHLESSDLAQIQSQTGNSAIMATATGATNYITVSASPTPTSVSPATVTKLSAGQNGHHKGDVIISLPGQPADLLQQLLRQGGAPRKCASTSSRKRGNGPNFDGINNLASFVLPMAAPSQLLHALGMQAADHLPALKGLSSHFP